MCMKYVNATVECYTDVPVDNQLPLSFNRPFNGIYASLRQDGTKEIGGFNIVTRISLLGTAEEEHKKINLLEMRGTLDVIVRLTKCSKNEAEQLCVDLDSFSIDTKSLENKIDRACYDFMNFTRITDVRDFTLDAGTGSYVIKILVKASTEKKYTIQSMTKLTVFDPSDGSN